MNTKTLKLEIPADIFLSLNKNEQEFLNQMKLYTALFLFQEKKLSLGKATSSETTIGAQRMLSTAQLSGLCIYDFMMEAGKHNVAVINYDLQDLQQELETLKEC